MSGSLNSLIYDPDAYAVDLRQSTAPMQWQLDPNYANHCKTCFVGDIGYLGKHGVSINQERSLIDIDSNLKLLNYRNTRNPGRKFMPQCSETCTAGNCDNPGYPCGGGISPQLCDQSKNCSEPKYHYKDCSLYTDYTRITNPSCTLRGTGVNRFQPMCLNFQDTNRWLHPSEVGINYRMVVKDNHHPRIPTPMDQTSVLPDPNAPKPTMPTANCAGAFTAPMHSYYVGLKTVPYQGKDC